MKTRTVTNDFASGIRWRAVECRQGPNTHYQAYRLKEHHREITWSVDLSCLCPT